MKSFKESYLKRLRVGNILLDSNVLMAPLSSYTSYPFRVMCRNLGAGLCFTEMVSSNGLKYHDLATRKLLFTTDYEYPKAVQLLGSNPNVFENACKSDYIKQFDIIDINMGCPVPNVIKSGEGCSLMGDLSRASKIIEACKRSGKVITVKFRVGLNPKQKNCVEFAKMCENSGADMITIHGRTRNMMYDGIPLYEEIANVKSVVKIPVIANGGIYSQSDAITMMENTNADGIMIARYGFENPLIFSELTGKHTNQTKYTLLLQQIDLTSKYFDEYFTLTYIKKLTAYFMKKLPGTKQYKQDLYRCGNLIELKDIIEKIFLKGGTYD
ncbi:MAG: tRNA dihydrouridine synthase [Oscillospiraceae bacterium]